MLTADYIVGLVDGEGSFTAYIRDEAKPVKRKRRAKAEPKFFLKLVEKDKVILEALQKFFGCGNVYFQKDTRRNHQNCYRFEVTSRKDLKEVIIPFFQQNPLRVPSKRRDFDIFCRLFARIENGDHFTKNGLRRLHLLKEQMH
ncbi:MAG: hypothetical protein A3A30_02890 [Candidatus Terrybacteria bacterium RIFCSPLOWO2_01_FULL_48_14]|nr:MAG: hypothetical protein A3A30_02890 [Candidatus Terrybacteria bacterium RIFCSPLOWO2_01_FULL_48_14]